MSIRCIGVARAWPLCTNMTSSTTPEVHNIWHSRHSSDEDPARPRTTCKEHLLKLGHVIFEIYGRTDRRTDTLIAVVRSKTLSSKIPEANARSMSPVTHSHEMDCSECDARVRTVLIRQNHSISRAGGRVFCMDAG